MIRHTFRCKKKTKTNFIPTKKKKKIHRLVIIIFGFKTNDNQVMNFSNINMQRKCTIHKCDIYNHRAKILEPLSRFNE